MLVFSLVGLFCYYVLSYSLKIGIDFCHVAGQNCKDLGDTSAKIRDIQEVRPFPPPLSPTLGPRSFHFHWVNVAALISHPSRKQ